LAEAILTLREEACLVDVGPCAPYPYPNAQNYDSSNTPCPTASATLTFTPATNPSTSTYEIPANSILCNGMSIFHDAVTGTKTLADLVVQMNNLLAAMGTWAVSASNITLTGTACSSVNLPWTI
jgi:hypothetical protein